MSLDNADRRLEAPESKSTTALEPSEHASDEARAIARHVRHMLAGCSAIPGCQLCDQPVVRIVRGEEYDVGVFCRDWLELAQLLVKSLRRRWRQMRK